MNSNLKNAAIGLLMIGAASGVVGGIGYGINQSVKNQKSEVTVTDPQKADEAIEKEGIFSRTLFEVKQKVGNLFTKQEQNPGFIVDLSPLCYQIAEHSNRNNQTIQQLDSLLNTEKPNIDEAKKLVLKADSSANEVRNSFEKMKKYAYIGELEDDFEDYEEVMKPLRERYLNNIVTK